MTANRAGRLSQMWTNLKKSLIIFRSQDTYVGSDEFGNKYFEKTYDSKNDIRGRRRVQPRDPDQYSVPTMPVEWMTWLQGRRADPPTQQERDLNKMNALKTQSHVAELEQQRNNEVNNEVNTSKADIAPVQGKSKSSFRVYPGMTTDPEKKL